MTREEAIEALELYATNDRQTCDTLDFAFRQASHAVFFAARKFAEERAEWHDDPEGDPEGYAEHHRPWEEQFDTETRAAVVMLLLERCERIRQENIANDPARKIEL